MGIKHLARGEFSCRNECPGHDGQRLEPAFAIANLVENSSNFQPYALEFREKSKFFAYFCAGAQEWAPEQLDKVKVKLLKLWLGHRRKTPRV